MTTEQRELSPYEKKSLRGLRSIGAGILTLEALVVALAIPVVLDSGHGSHTLRHITVAATTVVAVLLIVAGAELRRPWGRGSPPASRSWRSWSAWPRGRSCS